MVLRQNSQPASALVVLFIFAFYFSRLAFAGSLEEAEKQIQAKYAYYRPGYSETDTDFRNEINAVRENYARAQAEQAANAARAEAFSSAAWQNQLIQTQLTADQMKQNQLLQLAALEQSYHTSVSRLQAQAQAQAQENQNYQVLMALGLQFIVRQFLVSAATAISEEQARRRWQQQNIRQQKVQTVTAEAAKKRALEVEKGKTELRENMRRTEDYIRKIKLAADEIPAKSAHQNNFIQAFWRFKNAHHRYYLLRYHQLVDEFKAKGGQMKFPVLESDTFEDRVLAWDRVIKDYNKLAEQFNQIFPGLFEPFDTQGFYSDQEIGTLALLTNGKVNECKTRRISCGDGALTVQKIAMTIESSSPVAIAGLFGISTLSRPKAEMVS